MMQFSQFLKTWRVQGSTLVAEFMGGAIFNGPVTAAGTVTGLAVVAVPYSASMTFDASVGNAFVIAPTNATAFTINAPTNPPAATVGQVITVTIRNASGGAVGAATWNAAFRLSAWTNPANGFSRTISFQWNGLVWVEQSRTTVDVPN